MRTVLIGCVGILIFSTFVSFDFSNPFSVSSNYGDVLVSKWSTDTRDLTVEVYKQGTTYSARVKDFTCECIEGSGKNGPKGEHNAHPKCKNYAWVDAKCMWNLKYQGNKVWTDGYVKDLKSGSVYTSTVKLQGERLNVRGYFMFEWMGKSLFFNRER